MNAIQLFRRIALKHPESDPELIELPTGVAMLNFSICGARYCAENFPSLNAFGLSKLDGVSPFFEGVDESFASIEQLEKRITVLMEGRKKEQG